MILEGCGHVPQVERPEETVELLRSFMARAEQRSEPRPPRGCVPAPPGRIAETRLGG